MFFDVYSAAFYGPPALKPADALNAETPRVLVLHYHRSIDRNDIIEAASQILARQVPDQISALRSRIESLNAVYRSVQQGDRYSLTYSPATGTTLALNDTPLVTVPGADFATAYFGIWLSERQPLSEDLRKELLRAS
jgi:hypothetical protein